MICWDRLGEDCVVGIFEDEEILRLRGYVTVLRTRPNARPGRPGALHMVDDEVDHVLATLPAKGGVVELRSFTEVFAWLWVLTDLKVLVTEFGAIGSGTGEARFVIRWLETIARALYDAATD